MAWVETSNYLESVQERAATKLLGGEDRGPSRLSHPTKMSTLS